MKKSISVRNTPIQSSVIIPGSKSMTNRALLLAALAEGSSEITDVLLSDDTRALMDALIELGIDLQLDEKKLQVSINGCNGQFPKKNATIWCAEAGTVARFLLAACASSPGVYHFDAAPRMRKRPIQGLLSVLRLQGVTVDPPTETMPLNLIGIDGLEGGEVFVESSETGQFLSALLMIAPFAKQPVTIETKEVVSSSYVDMTCEMMSDFGVMVHRLHTNRFFVPTPQRYLGMTYAIEPDLSTASYFFAAAAITGGEVTIQPMNRRSSRQGDVNFLSVLEKMGCTVSEHADGLTVKGPVALKGVNVDMRHFSDTFMTLAALAPFATTPTTITNISHTRFQESDRMAVMKQELEKLQGRVEMGPDWIKIYPSQLRGSVIDSHNDHRIAMSFSVIGLRIPDMVIDGAECVSKTCPTFFDLWESL